MMLILNHGKRTSGNDGYSFAGIFLCVFFSFLAMHVYSTIQDNLLQLMLKNLSVLRRVYNGQEYLYEQLLFDY